MQHSNTRNLTNKEFHGFTTTNHLKQKKIGCLGKTLRMVKGYDVSNRVKIVEICLVPNVVVCTEFRVPEFVKYIGLDSFKVSL